MTSRESEPLPKNSSFLVNPRSIRTVLSNPGLILDYLTLRRRLSRFLQVSESSLRLWQRELYTSKLPAQLMNNWQRLVRGSISKYSGGATLGPANEVLYLMIRALRPSVVLETGTAAGFSTAFMLQALKDNREGDLFSISLHDMIDTGYPDQRGQVDLIRTLTTPRIGDVIPSGLRGRWHLTEGKTQTELEPLLRRIGPIGMFFRDDDHKAELMHWEFSAVWDRLSEDGLLVSDDVDWNGSYREFCEERGLETFSWFGRGAASRSDL